MCAAKVFQHLVHKNLSLYLYDNAHFYAERLYYEDPSAENLNLLAKCFVQQGKLKQAYLLLKESDDNLNRYLHSVVCIALKKYAEAEKALLPELYSMDPKNFKLQDVENVPGQSAGLYLLGLICRREHRKESAIFYFQYSLQMDPTFWSSICELSEMGVDIDLHKLLQLPPDTFPNVQSDNKSDKVKSSATSSLSSRNILESRIVVESIQDPQHSPRATSLGLSSLAMRIPFASPGPISSQQSVYSNLISNGVTRPEFKPKSNQTNQNDLPRALFEMSNSTITPFMKSLNLHESSIYYQDYDSPINFATKDGLFGTNPNRSKFALNDSSRRVSFGPTARLSFSGAEIMDLENNANEYLETINETNNDDEYPQKFHRIGSDVMTKDNDNQKPADDSLFMSPIANSTDTPNLMSSYINNQTSNIEVHASDNGKGIDAKSSLNYAHQHPNKAVHDVIESDNKSWSEYSKLMLIFSSAYKYVNLYHCQDCINMLKLLPKNHFLSGFVYQIIGRAYYEMCDYKAALLSLKEMLRFEPFRVKGTEILSTVLWHLKKEKELCTLAQQIIEIDKFSPEPWCVVGNCFSLQKEPDVAIRYFQRALQIDPTFTYAHTLFGHELVSNEDLDKAMKCFRTAILYDERHYNAWYGLGTIYYRQEKYDLAEFHFRKALSINNSSSVLKCFLGMVLQAQASFLEISNYSSEDEFIKDRDRKVKDALHILSDAVAVDPKNPQLRFQRAHVLTNVLNYLEVNGGDLVLNKSSINVTALDGKTYVEVLNEILRELEKVKEIAPREPPVYIMLAQTYQKLGRTLDAIKCYNLAIDLDPKEGSGIKVLLDGL